MRVGVQLTRVALQLRPDLAVRASPQVSSQWGLSRSFLGFIVLPIAGNACEHITGEALPLQL